MVKCRCGVWTNFGITCSKCALEDWTSKFSFGEDPEELDLVSLDDIKDIEDSSEDDL